MEGEVTVKTPEAIQDNIVAHFAEMGDAFNQFTYLLQLASELPEMPKERKIKEALVSGCQSQVWLYVKIDNGRIHLEGDSDTLMVRGIIRIFSLMFEGQTCDDVLNCTINFVDRTEIGSIFDDKRKAGVASIANTIYDAIHEKE